MVIFGLGLGECIRYQGLYSEEERTKQKESEQVRRAGRYRQSDNNRLIRRGSLAYPRDKKHSDA